jgi:hypothetical protein
MQLFRPLPPSLARTRLKYNALAQFLFTLIQHFFTPYGTIRRNLVFLLDEHVQHRVGAQSSWAALVIGGLGELLCLFRLSLDIGWNGRSGHPTLAWVGKGIQDAQQRCDRDDADTMQRPW